MSATGAALAPPDPTFALETTTSPVQTAAGDILMSSLFANSAGVAHKIYCCTSGTIAIKRINDAAFVLYPVLACSYLQGQIIAVGGTGSGTNSGMQWIAEI